MCSDPIAYCLRVVSDTDFFLFLAMFRLFWVRQAENSTFKEKGVSHYPS